MVDEIKIHKRNIPRLNTITCWFAALGLVAGLLLGGAGLMTWWLKLPLPAEFLDYAVSIAIVSFLISIGLGFFAIATATVRVIRRRAILKEQRCTIRIGLIAIVAIFFCLVLYAHFTT
jgi:uncharacterized protein YacL